VFTGAGIWVFFYNRRLARLAVGKGLGGTRHELAAPFGDLVRVHVEALGELRERRVAFERR